MANTENEPELFPSLTDPLDLLHTALVRMEINLDRCMGIVQAYELWDAVITPCDPFEKKVQVLIFAPFEGTPDNESLSWLGHAVLATKRLHDSVKADPNSSATNIAQFLNTWLGDTEEPAWAGKNTPERLHLLTNFFCIWLGKFGDDLLFAGEEKNGFAGDGTTAG